ncbi:MAG: SGNH/GDSL hydrolase family protein [Actinomycetota bacterium]|nr:SGNH/GDSL hydrolase family protein [Actinomycetota bacterium]
MSLRNPRKRLFGRTFTALATLCLSLGTVLLAGGAVSAQPKVLPNRGGDYLALGDSVAFGYIPSPPESVSGYADPSNFVSYANYTADALGLAVTNASCPGETTGSMINTSAISNGCENTLGYPAGYRTLYPLHVSYTGSQLAYAVSFLTDHSNTRLVTIDIGANDAFVCQELDNGCTTTAELKSVMDTIATNLGKIYYAIRVTAGYQGPIVALNYYSLSYANNAYGQQAMELSTLLNKAIDAPDQAFHVIAADGFNAFRLASEPYGGNVCAAGLLVKVPAKYTSIPGEDCNIHPSLTGHQILADAIVNALLSHGYEGAVASMGRAA